MSKKTWIIFVIVVVGLMTSLVLWSKSNSVSIDVSGLSTSTVQTASDQNGNIADHVFGKTDSKVVFIEYGDFQCAACATAYPGVKKVTEEYQDYIAFVFRNFPITSIHPNAKSAAAAVEAAGLQNKYWEMYDLIYSNQSQWESLSITERTDTFVSYANSLGIDTAKFTTDMSSTAINYKIAFDQALAKKDGVDSTPTFYINSAKQDNSILQSIQSGDGSLLKDALDAALIDAGVTPPKR